MKKHNSCKDVPWCECSTCLNDTVKGKQCCGSKKHENLACPIRSCPDYIEDKKEDNK